MIGVIIAYVAIILIAVLTIASLWKIFKDNGQPGWASLIEIYYHVVMCDIAGISRWYVALLFIPFVNIIGMTYITVKFANALGRSTLFGIGMTFLPFIFIPIAAFSKNNKKKVRKTNVKKQASNSKEKVIITKDDTKKEEKKELKKQVINPNKGIVLTLVLFIILLLFIVGATIPWESLISKFTAFSDFNKWLSDIKIGNYQIFNSIIGSPVVLDEATGSTTGVINALGSWTITDVSIFLFIITGIIGLCSKIKFNEFIETITGSIKKIIPIAITVMLVSIVLVLTVTTGINVTIANFILGITNGFNIVTSTITTVICSVLSSDFYYFLTTAGYAFSANVTNTDYYGIIAFIIQSIYHLTMVIAPTSMALVAGLYYLNIPYNKWIKYIWKALLTLFAIILVAAIILFVLI